LTNSAEASLNSFTVGACPCSREMSALSLAAKEENATYSRMPSLRDRVTWLDGSQSHSSVSMVLRLACTKLPYLASEVWAAIRTNRKVTAFKTKEESKLSVLEYILQPDVYPQLYKDFSHVVRINYYPPRGDNKEGWDNIDIFGWLGYKMQIKIDFLCRDSILAAPIVLDLALFLDLAQRTGMKGVQEWLSFYFKSPMTAPGLYPEHDVFIQLMKLKNTLRFLRGEDLITHLGLEYYD